MLRKVTDNFYILTRHCERWNNDELYIIDKYIDFDIFTPISPGFVSDHIFGRYDASTAACHIEPAETIMFNFDCRHGKRHSLRGMAAFSILREKGLAMDPFLHISLIGSLSIRERPASTAKRRSGVKSKSGKDMLSWIKKFALIRNMKYIKVDAVENVIGFYWKQGWRFSGGHNRVCESSVATWQDRIDKLNRINLSRSTDKEWIEEQRNSILSRHFDKFLEGYYNDTKLGKPRSQDELYELYNISDTLSHHRLSLRFNGYAMYWLCCSQ